MVAAVSVAVLTVARVAGDDESSWMEGLMLVAVHASLALGFFYLT